MNCYRAQLCPNWDPPLTTLEIPIHDLGVAAMGMLADLIPGWTAEKLKFFRTKLVIRESSGKIGSDVTLQ